MKTALNPISANPHSVKTISVKTMSVIPETIAAFNHKFGNSSFEPDRNCNLCPRLHHFLQDWRKQEPLWHNAPVAPFFPANGIHHTRLLIIGLAPGLRGANRTGRPFTGDYAGELLYATLKKFGFARGTFAAHAEDGLELIDTTIMNAVRCVPPQNKPTGDEIRNCRNFFTPLLHQLPQLRAIVTLGTIAHHSTVKALNLTPSQHSFSHGKQTLCQTIYGPICLFSSYHCSRYNTNTGVLTSLMFENIFQSIRHYLDSSDPTNS